MYPGLLASGVIAYRNHVFGVAGLEYTCCGQVSLAPPSLGELLHAGFKQLMAAAHLGK